MLSANTAKPQSAVIRATIPAVVGTLLKLTHSGANLLTYKSGEACAAGYPVAFFKEVNQGEHLIIKNAGVFVPEAFTIFVGACLAGFITESRGEQFCDYLSRAGKQTLTQLKKFLTSLTKEDVIHIVTLVAGAYSLELADKEIQKKYGFDPSGTYRVAVTYELLNSLSVRVIQRMEDAQFGHENQASYAYTKSATALIWLNSLVSGIMLSFTAMECHSLGEVATGIGYGVALHCTAEILNKAIDGASACISSCHKKYKDAQNQKLLGDAESRGQRTYTASDVAALDMEPWEESISPEGSRNDTQPQP